MPGNPRGAAWPSWIVHQPRSATQGGPLFRNGCRWAGRPGSRGWGVSLRGRLCLHAPPDQNKRRGRPPRALCLCARTNKQIKGEHDTIWWRRGRIEGTPGESEDGTVFDKDTVDAAAKSFYSDQTKTKTPFRGRNKSTKSTRISPRKVVSLWRK